MNDKPTSKYAFDTEFAADGTILRDAGGWRQNFTLEEVQIERDKAYQEGQRDALVKAEEASAVILENLSEQSARILSSLHSHNNNCRAEAMEVVIIAARKIAGQALECFPDAQVERTVQEVLKDIKGAPRLVVTCPTNISDSLEKNVQGMAEHSAFEGALVVRKSDDAQAGDISLEWAQGEVCISTEDIAERVENTVRQWLAATEAHEEAQPDLFAYAANPEDAPQALTEEGP
jgi:hypothetical protein